MADEVKFTGNQKKEIPQKAAKVDHEALNANMAAGTLHDWGQETKLTANPER